MQRKREENLISKRTYIQSMFYYEPEKLLVLAMVDKEIKFYQPGLNRSGRVILTEMHRRAYQTPFICTSMHLERHKVSKLLIGCFAGDNQFDIVIIDSKSPHAHIGIGTFGQTIFSETLVRRVITSIIYSPVCGLVVTTFDGQLRNYD